MNIESSLKQAGLKVTQNRVKILTALEGISAPVSANEVKERLPELDTVTIYRNLNDFTDKGIVRAVSLQRERMLYELAHTEHHHHVICEKCGKIEDLSICLPDGLEEEVAQKAKGFAKITDHQLEFKGICKGCAKSALRPASSSS